MPLRVVEVARKLDGTGVYASAHAGSMCTVTCDVPNSRSIAASTASASRCASSTGVVTRHGDRDLGEQLSRCRRSRSDVAHVADVGDAEHDAPQPCGVDRAFVDEYWDRLAQNLHAAPGDDQRDARSRAARRDHGQPMRANTSDASARSVTRMSLAGVRRVGQQKCAAQLATAPSLVPHDEYVDDERSDDDPDVDPRRRACGTRCATSADMPSRSSSKHEIDRNPTMPSAPSVSNLS